MRTKTVLLPTVLLALLVIVAGHSQTASGQDAAALAGPDSQKQMTDASNTEPETAPEKTIPGPKTAKERIAVYVFLAWTWATVFVLIVLIRGKIKESDRLYHLKYFEQTNERK
ncbi:MAG: hypothetical protein KKD56_06195 [Acidobacteria bacterium]|nr:hypothetical protein [Acidobacteriota bacterium]MBU1474275.1 hypothetical protein [Acidobacteriota bacterium]MBU2437816.1 hypothetical protein [Acidobacteriota bacterium]MBU4494376.1 hypothetical protein [Acidobacteriota bacterium]